jgi:hypothetical protein
MTEEEKVPFIASAAEDKERYEAEMAEYDPDYSAKRKRPSKEKDPNAPKRPMTAFFLFSIERRKQLKIENPDLKGPKVASELGALWKQLSDEEKRPFRTKGEEDMKQWQKVSANHTRTENFSSIT